MLNVTYPANRIGHISDLVSYRTTFYNKHIKDGCIVQDHIRAACYGSHMHSLPSYEFYCYPYTEKSILPKDEYFEWIRLCKENCLIPREAKADHIKGQNTLLIPRGNNRHLVYAALCCYRWSETIAPLAYTVIKLTGKLNFYQVFHYVAGLYLVSSGHNFMNIGKIGSYGNGIYGVSGKWYLPWSIALPIFFRKNKDGFSQADKCGDYVYTCTSIADAVIGLGMKENRNGELCVPKIENLLWEEWSCIYDMDPVKDNLVKYWKEVMEAKTKQFRLEKVHHTT